MKPRLVAAPAALALLALTPAANAATLTVNKPCFGANDNLVLTGTGFTPNAAVGFVVNTNGVTRTITDRLANPAGVFQYTSATPSIGTTRRRTDTFLAVDRTNGANGAAAGVLLSRVRVTVSPGSGNPSRRRRIRATGFTTGRTLYAHIRRGGKTRRNVRIGRLKGACKSISVRRRLLRGLRPGNYRVQFDVARRYKRTRRQRVLFNVTIFRTFRFSRASAASAASSGERWDLAG